MDEKKILGYRQFNSKTGKPYCILQTTYPFTDRELEHGACGNKIEEVWLPENLHSLVNPQIVGKMAHFTYTIQGNKAYIQDVTFK